MLLKHGNHPNENKLEMNFKPNKHELYLFNREKEREERTDREKERRERERERKFQGKIEERVRI